MEMQSRKTNALGNLAWLSVAGLIAGITIGIFVGGAFGPVLGQNVGGSMAIIILGAGAIGFGAGVLSDSLMAMPPILGWTFDGLVGMAMGLGFCLGYLLMSLNLGPMLR